MKPTGVLWPSDYNQARVHGVGKARATFHSPETDLGAVQGRPCRRCPRSDFSCADGPFGVNLAPIASAQVDPSNSESAQYNKLSMGSIGDKTRTVPGPFGSVPRVFFLGFLVNPSPYLHCLTSAIGGVHLLRKKKQQKFETGFSG